MNTTANAWVLIVEDNAGLRLALCDMLASYGYQVRSAADGIEALELLKTFQPDVVLCDIMMPGLDGYALLQRARSDPALRTLPFIFLTALNSAADLRRAKEIGVEDYLTKPVDSGDLVLAIENALQRKRRMQEESQHKIDEVRNRIVGLLQHEFRTPLTFVLGYAELIASTDPANLNWDELRIAAGAILDGGRRLQRLIEGFLLLAELQHRTLQPGDVEKLDAWTLWRDVAQEMEAEAAAAGLRIEIARTTLPVYITGDAHLIEEALRRLLDNAIRYRRADSHTIRLAVVQAAPYVGLRIADDGPGLAPTAVAEFERPFDQPNRAQRTAGGVGLSLPFIAQVAHLHGGRLQIESEPGRGSTFTLWLPAAAQGE